MPNPFGELKLGEPKPWKAVYRGIEYPGEVLLTDAWQSELGELTGDVHFRIVVLTRYQQAPDIADRRIACCIPGMAMREERKLWGREKGRAAFKGAGRRLRRRPNLHQGKVAHRCP